MRQCTITFLPSGKTIEVEEGCSLFEATRLAGLPLASACDGDAMCGRCRIQVIHGKESLSLTSLAELRLHRRLRLEQDERIACEARVRGDVTVTTGYW